MREWILIGLMLASVPLVLRRPQWGMIIYLGASIIRPEMLFWGGDGGSYLFKVYYLLILAGMFMQHYIRKLGQVPKRELLLMMWLLTAIFISAVLAQYPIYRGFYYIFEMVKTFGLCVMLYLLIDDLEDIKRLQNVQLACFAFMAVWGIDQHLRGNERLEGLGGNAWGDSNGVAAVFILFLAVAFSRTMTSSSRKQVLLYLGVTILMIVLIICTKSRSGLIGLIVALASFGFYSRHALKVVQIGALLAIAAMPFISQSYLERMQTMSGVEGFESSAQDRITLWNAGMMVFADNPLVGTGFLTFPEAKMKYENRYYYLEDEFRASIFRTINKRVTHNTYIQLLSDCGLLGAIPFILLVGGGIWRGFQARRLLLTNPEHKDQLLLLAGLSAGITGFAVCIFSIDAVLELNFYVQLVMVSILYRIIRGAIVTAAPEAVPARRELMAEGQVLCH
jgi:O-antigen ligase